MTQSMTPCGMTASSSYPAGLADETPQAIYARLMDARRGEVIEDSLARMLASRACGIGALPARLGLGRDAFALMLRHHFPGLARADLAIPADACESSERSDEAEDLRRLLLGNRSGRSESEIWMADILVAGCMGSDHLWQDLGLWNRADLSRLMLQNFEPLAKRNDKDMKWKKFLYKRLCESEGIYVCRAPSCEVCADYRQCFGPEE